MQASQQPVHVCEEVPTINSLESVWSVYICPLVASPTLCYHTGKVQLRWERAAGGGGGGGGGGVVGARD